MKKFAALGSLAAFLSVAPSAFAADTFVTALGEKGQIFIGELAGMRLSDTGTDFVGPIGLSYHRTSGNDGAQRTTNFWISPSADYFVADHISIGGQFEISTSSTSVDVPINANTKTTFDLPTATNFSALVRGGYMFRFGERFGLWPRAGLGYFSRQVVQNNNSAQASTKITFSGPMIGLDVDFVIRLSEAVYAVIAPEGIFSFAGSYTTKLNNNVDLSTSGSVMQLGLRTGVGVKFDL